MGRRLRASEMAVGHTLFQRTNEGLVLTDEGSAILGHAEPIEEVLAFERRLAGRGALLEGMLRVACSDWFGRVMLTPVLANLANYIRMSVWNC
jgi:DNA-binding transcriptional LysR family regulator